ncbi:MAG: sulfate permease [Thiobacillaceae bacterium]|nr:sulfate permease [Thiobacillaceae bacterium]
MTPYAALPAWLRPFAPFLQWWPQVNRDTTRDDAMAGLTGALIVLPQGVAFATIAGLPPQYGLYAAMLPAIIAALFGSSWHLVSGPTTAISIALFAALSNLAEPGSEEFIRLALTLTFLVGLYQLILGLARLGTLVNFISHTVVIGFTAGAAILIAASQIKNFFGIPMARGLPFYEVLHQLFLRLGDINPYVTAVALVTLAAGILARRYVPRFPYMIAAMLVGSLAAYALNALLGGEQATGIRTVGALPAGLPPLSAPDFSWEALRHLAFPALIITLLALTEAASISRSIATRSEQRIDGNQEFVGQGLSNLAGAFFSAYASSGSFNRSGVNYEAGARTPLAAVFASLFLVVILLLVAPLAAYLPTASMAGILFLVAWGLIDFHHIKSIWQTSKPEAAVLWVTLIGTLVNLEEGIFAGVTLSLVMYLYRTSRPVIEAVVPVGEGDSTYFADAHGKPECPQVRFVRIHGSLYFGAVDHVQSALQNIDEENPQHRTVVVAAPAVNFVDVAGAEMLAQEARRRRRLGGGLYFWRVRDSVHRFLRQGTYVKDIGEGAFFPVRSNITQAIYWTLDPDICRTCRTRIFRECKGEVLPDGLRRLRLMFATDGSDYSLAPRGVALALAKRMGVTLDVMTMAAPENDESALARLDAVTQAAAREGVSCETVIRHGGDPKKEVPAAAAAADTRLLVIGRRPPKGLADRMLGANAAAIIADTPAHVLVVPRDVGMWQKRILVGYDGTPAAQAAVDIALILAKASRLPVTLLTVVKEGAEPSPALAEQIEASVQSLRVEGVEAEARVAHGAPVAALIEQARALDADLVVVGTYHGGLNRLLPKGMADSLIGEARWPVLVAKAGKLTGVNRAVA